MAENKNENSTALPIYSYNSAPQPNLPSKKVLPKHPLYKVGYWMRLIGGVGTLFILVSLGPMGLALAGGSLIFGGAILLSILGFFVGHYLANNYKNKV
jgi:hypothetical protein